MKGFYHQRQRSHTGLKSATELKIEAHVKCVSDYMWEVHHLDYAKVMPSLGRYYPHNISVGGVALTPEVRAEYAKQVHGVLMAAHKALCKLQVTLNPELNNLQSFAGKQLTDAELTALKWIPAIAADLELLMSDPKLEFHYAQLSSLADQFYRPGRSH